MRLISSRATVVTKWIFPIVWFGVLTAIVVGMIVAGVASKDPAILLGPAFMGVIGFLVIRMLTWDLADTVYDFGSYLLVKRGGAEARIPLEDIMNVSASVFVNPPRVTLRLVKPSALGSNVSFSPKSSFSLNPFASNPVAEELMERAYAARPKRAV